MSRSFHVLALSIVSVIAYRAATPVKAQTPPTNAAYHGVSASQHQTHFNYYSSKGYRMISLSVYGDPDSPAYAAVWVKRTGPAWVASHNLSATQYENMFNTWTPQGYRPILVSATGSGSSAIFAVVFEKSTLASYARHGLVSGAHDNTSTIQYWMDYAYDNGYMPLSVTRYGTTSNPTYAAIWVANPSNVLWNWLDGYSSSGYQAYYDAFIKMRHRPAFPALSTNQLYLGVFRNDQIGPFLAYHGLSASEYQTKYDSAKAMGYYPISVQGGGTGSGVRYAAVFAKQEAPVARVWKVTGPTPTGMSSADAAKFDNAVKDFMQYHGIRAGQLSFSQVGKMLYTRAFTWAEPGYPITQTYSPMRLASCSKAFACAGITKLLATNPNLLETKVFALLGITALSGQTVDPKLKDITVGHCVDHRTGWLRSTYDPVFDCRTIGQLMGKLGPITNWDMAQYMVGMPLQYTPGGPVPELEDPYLNFGYVLLGLVVEKLTGQTFENYMMSNVLQPIGISDFWLARTDLSLRLPNEGYYDDLSVGYTVLAPSNNEILPRPNGGGGFLTEAMNTGGGHAATATSLTQFVNKYNSFGLYGRMVSPGRTGAMPGTISRMRSGPGMADFGFIFNTMYFKGQTLGEANDSLHNTLVTLLGKLPPHVSSLTVSSAAPIGGQSVTCVVHVDWAAPVGGAVINLTSSNTSAASLPASVTILEGNVGATFNVTTYPQTANATAIIKATYNGTSQSKTITVKAPALLSVALVPSSVTGGTSSTGTVSLSGPTAAPTTVVLSSNNSAAATPASVVVPSGASSATFTITTVPVAANASATITATMSGVSKTAALSVKAPVLLSLTLTPNPVAGGGNVTGTVAMSGPVKSNTTISLTNSNPKAKLPNGTNADTATILAGSASVSFVMTTQRPTARISGTVKAALGAASKSVTLYVDP